MRPNDSRYQLEAMNRSNDRASFCRCNSRLCLDARRFVDGETASETTTTEFIRANGLRTDCEGIANAAG